MTKQRQKLGTESLTKWLIVIFALACLAAIIVYGAYFVRFSPGSSFSTVNGDWGTFGDFIGGTLNPIFSFLGLIALLLTIIIQNNGLELARKELELTRLELEATRGELKRSAMAQEATQKVMDEQSKTQLKQQFEGTFFALLNQHNDRLTQLKKDDVLRETLYHLANCWRGPTDLSSFRTGDFETCIEYLRMIQQLLDFLANNTKAKLALTSEAISEKLSILQDDHMYASIIKAHLGGEIICLIGYYAAFRKAHNSNDRFAWLTHNYSLINNIPARIYSGNNIVKHIKELYGLPE